MKKLILLTVACMFVAGTMSAQDTPPHRRGYIGISFGPAFPTGDLDPGVTSGGAHTNLVNFGYLAGKHVGVAETWFGTAFGSNADDKYHIGMGGMLFGPLFSTSSKSGEVDFDFRPMIGFARGSELYNGKRTSSSSMAFALGLCGAVRWNCISVSSGLDYYNSRLDKLDLSSLGLVFGVNYRFR